MKKLLLLSAALLMINAEKVSAKIWTVNNNLALAADFRLAQAAVNSANYGDTVYFEPSTINYGNIIIDNKKLAIITNSSKNGNFGIVDSNSVKYATLGTIQIQNSDSVFVSARFTSYLFIYSCTNIVMSNCYGIPDSIGNVLVFGASSAGGAVLVTNCTNLQIKKSVFRSASLSFCSGAIEIRNNILAFGVRSKFTTGLGLLLDNNTFHTNPSTGIVSTNGYVDTLNNAIVTNNIYYHRTNTYFVNCVVQNNLEFAESSAIGANNLMGLSTASPGSYVDGNLGIAIGTVVGPGIFSKTSVSSNLTDNGWGTVGQGAIGGADPYLVGAPPPIPAVTSLQVSPLTNIGSLNVQFSSISNK
jgi:hypothetical protein